MSTAAPVPEQDPDKLTPEAKRVLLLAFLTLFIDLIGFSIIFPLFPAMLDFYRQRESATGMFGMLISGLEHLAQWVGNPNKDAGILVLFGGILGSVYSLLQFACAPVFGSISDEK